MYGVGIGGKTRSGCLVGEVYKHAYIERETERVTRVILIDYLLHDESCVQHTARTFNGRGIYGKIFNQSILTHKKSVFFKSVQNCREKFGGGFHRDISGSSAVWCFSTRH